MTLENILREGITALKDGRRNEARKLFMEIIRKNPNEVSAWLWLSGAVDTNEQRRECLEKVLALDPENPHAKKGLDKLDVFSDRKELNDKRDIIFTKETSIPNEHVQETENKPRKVEEVEKPTDTSQEARRRLIQREIGWYTKYGWELVYQTEDAFQIRKGKELRYITIEQIEQRISTAGKQQKKTSKRFQTWEILIGSIIIMACICVAISLLIPSSDFADKTPKPTRTNEPELVDILHGWECEHDGIGNMIIKGKVINLSDSSVAYVRIRGAIFDNAGNIVNTSWGYADSDILLNDSTSTFTIYISDPNNAGKKCSVLVEDYDFR